MTFSLALPVLPLYLHQGLGLGTFVVGRVTGSQFAASLICRVWAGHYADIPGAKRAVASALVLPYAAFHLSLCVFVLRGYFAELPVELSEAAALNGASAWQVFFPRTASADAANVGLARLPELHLDVE